MTYVTPSEEYRIIRSASEGDKSAFETLVRDNRIFVYNLALKLLKNHDDAMDASQEAFIKAYVNLKSFRYDSKFSVWLYRITYNICLDMLRRSSRFPVRVEGDDGEEAIASAPAPDGDPVKSIEKKEFWEEVNAGLDTLPEEQRSALVLREITGLSYYEIAKILGCSEGTVKSRISRGRQKLASFITGRGTFSATKRHNSANGGERK